MATEITKVELGLNAQDTAAEAFTDVTTSSAAYVDVDGVDASKLILQVNYDGADTAAIYKIVDGAAYTGGEVGDLSIGHDIGGDTFFVGPFETARFKDSDGHINIEATSDGSTSVMSFRAILLP